MGKIDTAGSDVAPPPPGPLKPSILPALQYQSVIAVVLGDYHYGALTADGTLLTWGAFSRGALGLGDPMQLEPGTPGGFRTARDKQTMLTVSHMAHTPPDVVVPTSVRFARGEHARKTYCFAVAAAGWHMGALVIDLEVRTCPLSLSSCSSLTHCCSPARLQRTKRRASRCPEGSLLLAHLRTPPRSNKRMQCLSSVIVEACSHSG